MPAIGSYFLWGAVDYSLLVTKLNLILDNQNCIMNTLRSVQKQETKEMAAIDDLNAAVADLAQNFITLDNAIQSEIATLQNALSSNDTQALQAAIATISNTSKQMASDAAALKNSVTPLPPPIVQPPVDQPPADQPVVNPEAAR